MMINTYKLLKGLNILLVYNIMALTLLTVLFHNMHVKALKVKKLYNDTGVYRDMIVEEENSHDKIQSAPTEICIQLGLYRGLINMIEMPEFKLGESDYNTVHEKSHDDEKPSTYSCPNWTFKNYGFLAYAYLRSLFDINKSDYLDSLCKHQLIKLPKPGISRSKFYITEDQKFIIKTIKKRERELLRNMLKHYINHLNSNQGSMLTKFTGLYEYIPSCLINIILVIMINLLPSDVEIHEMYDLKGSTNNRYALYKENMPTYKKNNFNTSYPEGILLMPNTLSDLLKIIKSDCDFLKEYNIKHYSLLIGIHYIDQVQEPDTSLNKAAIARWERLMNNSIGMDSIQDTTKTLPKENFDSLIGSIPALGDNNERLLLFVGIIDVFQKYRISRKVEHLYKIQPINICVRPPKNDATGFYDFLSTSVFKPLSSEELKNYPSNIKVPQQ